MWIIWRIIGYLYKAKSDFINCPHCSFDGFDMYQPPYFVATSGGVTYVPGDVTIHWFEGIQTCPRCRHKWEVADSD